VVVLIDCGATHNFISTKRVERLQLPVTETYPYLLEVGDKGKVSCRGICKSVHLQVQELCIQQDFYLFGLGGSRHGAGVGVVGNLGRS